MWLNSHYTEPGSLAEIASCLAAFAAIPGKSVDQKIKTLGAHRRRANQESITHAKFSTYLQHAEALFEIAGSKALKADISKLKKLFADGIPVPIDQFTANLKIDSPSTPARRAATPSELNVSAFSERLESVVASEVEFNRLVSQLVAPRAYSIDQINAVAGHFLGYSTSFKQKSRAAAALKQRQADTVIGGAQTEQIEARPV